MFILKKQYDKRRVLLGRVIQMLCRSAGPTSLFVGNRSKALVAGGYPETKLFQLFGHYSGLNTQMV